MLNKKQGNKVTTNKVSTANSKTSAFFFATANSFKSFIQIHIKRVTENYISRQIFEYFIREKRWILRMIRMIWIIEFGILLC